MLYFKPNYIAPSEESNLLQKVASAEWDTEWRRRVQRYGVIYGTTKQPETPGPLPDWLRPLAEKEAKARKACLNNVSVKERAGTMSAP